MERNGKREGYSPDILAQMPGLQVVFNVNTADFLAVFFPRVFTQGIQGVNDEASHFCAKHRTAVHYVEGFAKIARQFLDAFVINIEIPAVAGTEF